MRALRADGPGESGSVGHRRSGPQRGDGGRRADVHLHPAVGPDRDEPEIDPALLGAEQACLGQALRSTEALEVVLGTLESTDYARPAHRIIHEALMELYPEHAIDAVVVAGHLNRPDPEAASRGGVTLLERAGRAAYLHDLMERAGLAGSVGHHVHAVLDAARMREAAEHLETARRFACTPGVAWDVVEREIDAARERLREHTDGRWSIPRPLSRPLPPLPVTSLPPVVRRITEAAAASTQTPPDLAAFAALATLSAAARGQWEVAVRGPWREQTCLYLAGLSDSGTRKSAVVKAVGTALFDLEKSERTADRDRYAAEEMAYQLLEDRVKAARKRAGEIGPGDDYEQACSDAQELAVELASATPPAPFRLTCDDVTPEVLAKLMATHGGVMAVLTAEGGLLGTLAGRYSKDGKGGNIDLALKAFNGERYQVDRITRDTADIERPILTLGMIVQPDVLAQATKVPEFTQRGLLPRMLFCLPESTVGTRGLDPPDMPPDVAAEWSAVVEKIFHAGRDLVNQERLGVIYLDHGALTAFDRWRGPDGHEGRLHKDLGDLADMQAWASKLPGALVRIAALFALAERPGDASPLITEAEMRAALDLAPYLIEHAREVLLAAQSSQVERLEAVLGLFRDFVQDHDRYKSFNNPAHGVDGPTVSLREAHQLLHGRSWVTRVEDVEDVFERLADLGYVRRLPAAPAKRGRPPSPRYQVNPRFLASLRCRPAA